MNPDSELFKKLVKDAGIQLVHWDDSPRLYIENMTYDEKLVKFAELIIEHCGIALSPMLRDMVSRGQAYDLIKEHFGVEE
jgi:hypothetical protein